MSIINAGTTSENTDLQNTEFLWSFILHVTYPIYQFLYDGDLEVVEFFLQDYGSFIERLKDDGFDFNEARNLHKEAFVSSDFTQLYDWVNGEMAEIKTKWMMADDEPCIPNLERRARLKAGMLKAMAEHKAQQQDNQDQE